MVLMNSHYSEQSEQPQFWYNLKTAKVEVGPQSFAKNRVGPFGTRGEAEQALNKLREQSEKWQQSDDD